MMTTCESCAKPAKFACPTCLKQSIESHFCSQDCFKLNWPVHKSKHTGVTTTLSNPWPNYAYTGAIRPKYPLSARRGVLPGIAKPDYANDSRGYPESEMKIKGSSTIPVLTPAEISQLRAVCKIGREVLEVGASLVKPGTTTDEIDRAVHDACMEAGGYPSPLNYFNFPKSCCTSVNEVICHGIPDQYELLDGDIVNIDVSVYKHGLHTDLNETYLVGNVDQRGRELVSTTRKCLDEAIAMCKPGVLYRDLGNKITKVAEADGFSVVKTYCGHGVGKYFHCPPNIPHYAKNKAVGVMKPGHAFTIEPMICEGTWQDATWPDNWTAVTKDGKRSAQFEETLLVTETGVEVLTKKH